MARHRSRLAASVKVALALLGLGRGRAAGRDASDIVQVQPNALTAGAYHMCALLPDGAVDCWGNNDYGQAEDQAGPYGPNVPLRQVWIPLVS